MSGLIKVLHLRDTYEVGGPGKTILETVSHIDKSLFSVSIAVFGTGSETGESPFLSEARNRGITVHEIRSRGRYDPLIIREIVFLVKKFKIDVLHTHEAKSDLLGYLSAKMTHTPIISTMHGWITNNRKEQIYTKVDKMVARFFDRVIVVNAHMREVLLKEGVPSRIISLLHNCIVKENYYRDQPRGYIRQSLGKEIRSPVIGTLGRLSLEKGHVDFVEAAADVLSRGHKAHFVIVGDGPEAAKIAGMISERGLGNRVTMTGYMRDPRKVLQDFDLMVLPSLTEGFPNVVLEALMMEVPVISTDVGGVPEIIRDGEEGVLIPPGDPGTMARAMVDFLGDKEKYNRMALQGKKIVEERFDFRSRTRKLEKIYTEVMERGKNN